MTSIAFSWKWCPESRLAISSSGASLRVDQVIDCSFKGYERQPLALSIRVRHEGVEPSTAGFGGPCPYRWGFCRRGLSSAVD